MSITILGQVKLSIQSTHDNTVGLSTARNAFSLVTTSTFANGTGSGKAQIQLDGTMGFTAGQSQDLNLSEISGPYGTGGLTSVKYLFLNNTTTDTGAVLQAGGTGNPFSTPFGEAGDKLEIGPGGIILLASPVNGYGVISGTGDVLTVENVGSATAELRYVLIGEGSIS